MIYLFYFFLGITPSIIWLLFFLRKDAHPEPNRMIIFVFVLGMAFAPIIAFFECLPMGFSETGKLECFNWSFFSRNFPFPLGIFLYMVFVVALIEEVGKYLVVKLKVLRSSEFDEPTDIMLYMIIAALGFAAIENILNLFFPKEPLLIWQAPIISVFRFIGPVFLHALTSGTIGYFLAKSFFEPKRKNQFLIFGFALAIFLHGLFNYFIMMVEKKLIIWQFGLFMVILILIFLAVFVILSFKNLKKIASICKVK